MKYITLAIIAIFYSTTALALSATTKEGYVACVSEETLDEFVSLAVANDIQSMDVYLAENKCFSLKDGLRVTTIGSIFNFTTVEFIFKGYKLWTVREALNYEK